MAPHRSSALRRWAAVAVGTALLVAVPVVLRSLPAAQSDVSAGRLLTMVRSSQDRGWSGFVETSGGVQLPDASHFSDVASLFGGATQLRVWWRDQDHWRVDRLATAGETDLIHELGATTEYDYEHARARINVDPSIRLPRAADLLPPELARRALNGADPHVARLPARRVAGISAPGLRLTPASSESSVDHVDLWADPSSGVPVRVEVYASAHGHAAFTTAFRDFSSTRPSTGSVRYTATAQTNVEYDSVLDIADAANQYAPLTPPATAAGLRQSSLTDGAVGVYGAGLTQVIAIPLRDREADPLRQQLTRTPGVVQSKQLTSVQVGILDVALTGRDGDGGWLLAGTLDQKALARAALDVLHGFRYVDSR